MVSLFKVCFILNIGNVTFCLATSVIDFCRCIEGYGKYTVNRKTPGNVQLSDWLDCNGDVVFYRNKLAHAEDKPRLEILRRLVVIALNWMKKYFFPNLSIDSRGSISMTIYFSGYLGSV